MDQAKNGDKVKVHYTGTLEDGTRFDSSVDRDPIEFTIGEGKIIRGFEQAVLGMKTGETKSVKVAADDAYGPHREELVMTVERSELPPDLDPVVGQALELRQADRVFPVKVTEVSPENVTLDANHPLAGETLCFDIELVAIA